MKNNIGYFEKAKALLVVVVLTLILLGTEFYLVQRYYDNQLSEDQSIIKFYEDEYKTIIEGYSGHAATYYNEALNSEEIIDIISKANISDDNDRDVLRNELIEIVEQTYYNIKDDNFRQLHFVLKDCTSFLRMHSLDNYGDNLRDVRKTVEIVADTKSYVEGFEEGRVYNGYRFEYPLFKDEEFIGCVEISMSYSSIFELMDTMFDSPGLFILSKEVVDTKVWDDEKELNYVDCDFSDQYYYDKESYDYFINNEKYTLIANNFLENCEEMDNLKFNLVNGDTFIQNLEYENTTYSIVFLKVVNVSEENVGYLVFLRENSIYKVLLNSIKSKTILIICLWILFIIFIFKYFKYKAEREKITYFDNLTGALNRNSLFDQITYHTEMYKRYDNKFSIIMFDIDKFKKVNDLKGHMAGDKVLKMVTYITKDNIRKTDRVYRYGGDEFLIILPNTEIQYATIVAEKIRKMVEETEFLKIKDFNITLSLGVVECEDDIDVDKILIKVDKRLYKAKNSGRNKVVSIC